MQGSIILWHCSTKAANHVWTIASLVGNWNPWKFLLVLTSGCFSPQGMFTNFCSIFKWLSEKRLCKPFWRTTCGERGTNSLRMKHSGNSTGRSFREGFNFNTMLWRMAFHLKLRDFVMLHKTIWRAVAFYSQGASNFSCIIVPDYFSWIAEGLVSITHFSAGLGFSLGIVYYWPSSGLMSDQKKRKLSSFNWVTIACDSEATKGLRKWAVLLKYSTASILGFHMWLIQHQHD